MISFASLWLPILLSAVVVFVTSSLLHMVLKYHRSDYAKAPNEDALLDALRSVPPNDYMLPYASGPDEMREPAFQEKMDRGPIAQITLMTGGMQARFKKALVLWFVYSLVVSAIVAHLAQRALPVGAPYHHVFHFVALTAFLGYALALAQQSIWFGRKWSTTLRSAMDGLIYAMLSAGVFGWLWPR